MIKKPIDVKIREVLAEQFGVGESHLEVQYENTLVEGLMEECFDTKHEWATYNQVVVELKNNLKEYQLAKELQYRLSDYESPKNACIDVITNTRTVSPELQRLYEKITNFMD
jgi:hypothetical protein